jgi:hypothetical protein
MSPVDGTDRLLALKNAWVKAWIALNPEREDTP